MTTPVLLLLAAALGVDRPQIVIEGGKFRPLPLAVAPFKPTSPASAGAARQLEEVVANDLYCSGFFDLLDRKSFLADTGEGLAATSVKWSRWTDVGAEALIKAEVGVSGGTVSVDFRLYTVAASRQEMDSQVSAPEAQARTLAHAFADAVVRFYTREDGSFRSQAAYVRKVRNDKKIVVSDWDGWGARVLTDGGLSLMPSWSRDARLVAYTSYRGGNPELYTYDLASGSVKPLVKLGRLATGAAWSPDGKKLAFSMAEASGDSHIYLANADGSSVRRVTSGFGINTSPTWAPDGKRLAFVSNAAGNPQIYLIDVAGGAPKRLTFQGNYNQTPDWSARGDAIAFTARDERNAFDLFSVNPDNGKITRLTQDQGNNEEPSFSPNGRMILFTSTGTGRSQLWVMSADGRNQRQLTDDKEGEVYTPAWGPRRP